MGAVARDSSSAPVTLTWSVADIRGPAALVDVTQPDEDIGMREAGPQPNLRTDLPDDLHVLAERVGGVDEDIRTGLDLTITHGGLHGVA
jgi:hypothetical protein